MPGPHPAVAAVRGAVRRHCADLGDGQLVLAACSGGADSVAMAAALSFEGPRQGLRVGAVTIDHAWTADSPRVAAETVKVCVDLGYPLVEVLGVEGPQERLGGPEAAARTLRYRLLEEAADRLGAACVLLGHTRDDQAETVLIGLARGSGPRSMAGMEPVRGRWRRPLLDITRAQTRAACEAEGLPVWDDPANAEDRYLRVRVRQRVLPVLEAELGPGVAAALARTGQLLQEDLDALDRQATLALGAARAAAPGSAEPGWPVGAGTVVLDVAVLAGLHRAVRRRVLRLAVLDAGVPGGQLGSAHLLAADRLVTDWSGQGEVALPGGHTLRRHAGGLEIGRRA